MIKFRIENGVETRHKIEEGRVGFKRLKLKECFVFFEEKFCFSLPAKPRIMWGPILPWSHLKSQQGA